MYKKKILLQSLRCTILVGLFGSWVHVWLLSQPLCVISKTNDIYPFNEILY